MNTYPVWIDCDIGVDDAIAIMAAHALPQIDLLGISTTCGNASQENTYRNAHRLNGLLGTDYPVYRGAASPLCRELLTASHFHGNDGLGDVDLPVPPDAVYRVETAWDALYEAAVKYPHTLRLIALGPLTNVATAFSKYPDLPGLLHSMLIMGGAAVGGNVTPAAEFNIYCDPEAAELVFDSGVHIAMCGLDVTLKALLRPADWDELAATGTRAGKFVRDCVQCAWTFSQKFGLEGVAMHDSCPVLYLVHPELFRTEEAGVRIETRSTLTLGKTVTDLYSDKQFDEKNATVVLDVDRDRFIEILKDCIKAI